MAVREERRKHPRVTYEEEIEIEFSDIGEFVKVYAANLSLGGMFIKTSQPFAPGTEFNFRFSANANQIIAGRAMVTWVKQTKSPDDDQTGMGVRFTKLDDLSKAVIFKIVDMYIQESGQEPFSINGS